MHKPSFNSPTGLLACQVKTPVYSCVPLNESEAGVDLVLIETFGFSYVNDSILMLISWNLHKKSSVVSVKRRLTPASLSFKGRATKWFINSHLGCHVTSVYCLEPLPLKELTKRSLKPITNWKKTYLHEIWARILPGSSVWIEVIAYYKSYL